MQFDDAHKLIVGHPELAGAGILVKHLGLQEAGVSPEQFLAVSAAAPAAAIHFSTPRCIHAAGA